jgi:hypothetical protein
MAASLSEGHHDERIEEELLVRIDVAIDKRVI